MSIFEGFREKVIENSPTLLMVGGIVLMTATVVVACKATPKAKDIIDERKEQRDAEEFERQEWNDSVEDEEQKIPEPTAKEKVKEKVSDIVAVAPVYAPAVVLGVCAITCFVSGNHISGKRIAALSATYAMSEADRILYRTKAAEIVGKEKEKMVREAVGREKFDKNPPPRHSAPTEEGLNLVYDVFSDRYFHSSINKIERAVNKMNAQINSDMYISLNEFYGEIGLKAIEIGTSIGWNVDNLIDIDFSSELTEDNVPCIVMQFYNMPAFKFDRLR